MVSAEGYEARRSRLWLRRCLPREPDGRGHGPRVPAAVARTKRRAGAWRLCCGPLQPPAAGPWLLGGLGLPGDRCARSGAGRAGREAGRWVWGEDNLNKTKPAPRVCVPGSRWGAVRGFGSVCLAARDAVLRVKRPVADHSASWMRPRGTLGQCGLLARRGFRDFSY